jgi:soluble lytic murein transglycosylase
MLNKLILFVLVIFSVLILMNAEKLLFPVRYKESVIKYSSEFNLEPELVLAVIKAESSFSKDAVSSKNATGLMQLMYETAYSGAKELKIIDFTRQKLLEPDVNIRLGCWYMKKLINEYDSTNAMIASYNAGGKNFRNWFVGKDYKNIDTENFAKNLKFKETKNFFTRVLNNYNKYKKIYKGNLEE